MSNLKPGTLCVIVGGCPENIGIIVGVLEHIGPCLSRAGVYRIRTVSGRDFPQLKTGPKNILARGNTSEAITDCHKLRPLIDVNDYDESSSADQKAPAVSLDQESVESNARRCHV